MRGGDGDSIAKPPSTRYVRPVTENSDVDDAKMVENGPADELRCPGCLVQWTKYLNMEARGGAPISPSIHCQASQDLCFAYVLEVIQYSWVRSPYAKKDAK